MKKTDPTSPNADRINRLESRDIRDSVFSMIRSYNPTTEAAMAGLLNALGAVIAERAANDPTEIHRLIGVAITTLPQYVAVYHRDNPLT